MMFLVKEVEQRNTLAMSLRDAIDDYYMIWMANSSSNTLALHDAYYNIRQVLAGFNLRGKYETDQHWIYIEKSHNHPEVLIKIGEKNNHEN